MNATCGGDQSLGTANGVPVDPVAVRADDALLDALTSAPYGDDAELARVLVAWWRDVDAEPVGELVDAGTALAAISSGRPFLARIAAAVRGFFRLGGDR